MVPTDEAMITRQMLYSGVLLPATATAAFAIPPPCYLQYFSPTNIWICADSGTLPRRPTSPHCCSFRKIALTVNSDPDNTVSSRFHWVNPDMEKTTTCGPGLTAISDGVLPTYLPSRVLLTPGGVEVKLHFPFSSAFSGSPPSAAAGGWAGADQFWAAGAECGAGAG